MSSCPAPFSYTFASMNSSAPSLATSETSADTTTPSPPLTPQQQQQSLYKKKKKFNNTMASPCSSSHSSTPASSSQSSSSTVSKSSLSPAHPPSTAADVAGPTSAMPYTANFITATSLPLPSTSTSTTFDLINHPIRDTMIIVSTMLSTMVQRNDNLYDPLRDPITLFHSRTVPRISIEAYLIRILQYIPFTNEVLLNVLVYLDRIGGLEGLQLQGNSNSTRAVSPVPVSPSTRNSTLSSSSSSSINNSDNYLPMSQKRGREAEDGLSSSTFTSESEGVVAGQGSKRPRTQLESTPVLVAPSPPATPIPGPAAVWTRNGFRINSFNIHRLLITCLLVAAKFTSDLFYSNARYAKVGGLSLQELNQLELELLFTTKFELNVKVDELQRVGDALLHFRNRHMACFSQEQLQLQLQQQQKLQDQQLQQLHLQLQQQQRRAQNEMAKFQQEFQHMQRPVIPSPISPHTAMPASTPGAPQQQSQESPQYQGQGQVQQQQQQQQHQTQLLSPPEEKHTWSEDHVQETHAV